MTFLLQSLPHSLLFFGRKIILLQIYLLLFSFAAIGSISADSVQVGTRGFRKHDNPGQNSQFGHSGPPKILTEGRLHRVKVGETLMLACDVRNLGPMVLMWKKGHRVLTAGSVVVKRDKRIELNGTNVKITDMNIHDGGEYSCEVETDDAEPTAVVHTVEILVPPSVMPEPSSGKVVVRKDTTVTLECKANGNPSPTVTWTKRSFTLNKQNKGIEENDFLDDHKNGENHRGIRLKRIHKPDLTNNGMQLTLRMVNRRDAGVYECTATNGVGQDAKEVIELQVLYEPEVVVHEPIVLSDEDHRASLMCHVYADPEATVTWYKNTLLLQKHPRYRHILPPLHHPHKHELVVESVSIEDFANYTCLATNNMGKAEGAIELRGNPMKPLLSANVRPVGYETWRIAWITESYANISEYRLLYRKVPDGHNHLEMAYAWNNIILPGTGTWRGVESREKHFSYDLKHLSNEASYEAQVQSKNKFGWSERSELLRFYTQSQQNTVSVVTSNPLTSPEDFSSIPYSEDDRPHYPGDHSYSGGRSHGQEGSANAHIFGTSSASKFLKTLHLLLAVYSLLVSYFIEQLVSS